MTNIGVVSISYRTETGGEPVVTSEQVLFNRDELGYTSVYCTGSLIFSVFSPSRANYEDVYNACGSYEEPSWIGKVSRYLPTDVLLLRSLPLSLVHVCLCS